MPAMNFNVTPLQGVNLEILSLDMNIVDAHKTCPWIACGRKDCVHGEAVVPGCDMNRCHRTMQERAEVAFHLLDERVSAAAAARRQLLVISHYPTTYLNTFSYRGRTINDLLRNPKVSIVYFGGHVHATDNITNVHHGLRRHGWNDFCVGGGGGWACDANPGMPSSQGFVSGVVKSDGSLTNFRFHMAADSECCFMNPRSG